MGEVKPDVKARAAEAVSDREVEEFKLIRLAEREFFDGVAPLVSRLMERVPRSNNVLKSVLRFVQNYKPAR